MFRKELRWSPEIQRYIEVLDLVIISKRQKKLENQQIALNMGKTSAFSIK